MSQLAFIALGGAFGAVARFLVSNGIYALLGRGFPWGTLAVNVLGSLMMGVLAVLMLERLSAGSELRGLLLVGFLGAFTTFSTFSIETLNLIEDGALWRAGLNATISVLLCLLAAWFGVGIGRQL